MTPLQISNHGHDDAADTGNLSTDVRCTNRYTDAALHIANCYIAAAVAASPSWCQLDQAVIAFTQDCQFK
jgi:hypothetical protein